MVDAEEAAARERDVPRRLLGEHRGGPPGSRAPQAALCAARSPPAPEPGLHRPAGPSVAAARGLSRRSWGLCAEAAILAGGGAEPARAGLSGRAGNGRAPGPRPRPARGPALPGSPPGPGDPAPSPGPEAEAPPAVQHPRALKRRTCGPAKGPDASPRPPRPAAPPPPPWTAERGGRGPRAVRMAAVRPGTSASEPDTRERRALLSGQHPASPRRRPPPARDTEELAAGQGPEGPTETHHRITRKHTGLRANHSSQREHWRLRPAPDLPAELRPPRSHLYLGTKLVSTRLLSQLLGLWGLLRGESSPDPPSLIAQAGSGNVTLPPPSAFFSWIAGQGQPDLYPETSPASHLFPGSVLSLF